jgi:hypothetical protein
VNVGKPPASGPHTGSNRPPQSPSSKLDAAPHQIPSSPLASIPLLTSLGSLGSTYSGGLPGLPAINTGKAPILASCFSDVFTVFSAKKFPGVVESTELSKCFANQGIKIPIRKEGGQGNGNLPGGERRRASAAGGGGGDGDDEDE